MKKISTTALFITMLVFNSFAQTTRLELLEQFSSATCAPCAAANPTLNATLSSNANKIVSIKYQVGWPSPGNDPMYLRNTTEVNARVAYYSVSAVPHSVFEGNQYTGSPSGITTSRINNRSTVQSPFEVKVSYNIPEDYDSIYVTTVIKAVQDTTNSNLKAYVVITEKHIEFESPASTNGEKDFYSVMRKMLPNSSGIELQDTFLNGDSIIIEQSWKFDYIYNISSLAVVSFIQDNTTKEILQTGYAQPMVMNNDAGLLGFYNLPLFTCEDTILPQIILKNYGSDTLYTAKMQVKFDNVVIDTLDWFGALATDQTDTIAIDSLYIGPGSHQIMVTVLENNEIADYNINYKSIRNNQISQLVQVSPPIMESFQSTIFPPTNWTLNNADGAATWTRKTGVGAFGLSTSCSKMDFYNSPTNQIDELYLPSIDLTNETDGKFYFSLAYQMYGASYADKLEVQVSTDCGNTWTNLYSKAGLTLRTVSTYKTSAFTPTATQWRTDTINLSSYYGQSNVALKFKATSKYGNNLYIDDIKLDITTGIINIDPLIETQIHIYPNPAQSSLNISSLQNKDIREIVIYNISGSKVFYSNKNINQLESIDLTNFNEGLYFIKFISSNDIAVKKFEIIK